MTCKILCKSCQFPLLLVAMLVSLHRLLLLRHQTMGMLSIGNMQTSSIEVGMVELGQVVWLGEVNLKCRVTAVMV